MPRPPGDRGRRASPIASRRSQWEKESLQLHERGRVAEKAGREARSRRTGVHLCSFGAVGFGTLLCTVGFQCRREGKECLAEKTQSIPCAGGGQRAELAGSRGILSLLAWELIAVQKACQSPHVPARCHWGFPHR